MWILNLSVYGVLLLKSVRFDFNHICDTLLYEWRWIQQLLSADCCLGRSTTQSDKMSLVDGSEETLAATGQASHRITTGVPSYLTE